MRDRCVSGVVVLCLRVAVAYFLGAEHSQHPEVVVNKEVTTVTHGSLSLLVARTIAIRSVQCTHVRSPFVEDLCSTNQMLQRTNKGTSVIAIVATDITKLHNA